MKLLRMGVGTSASKALCISWLFAGGLQPLQRQMFTMSSQSGFWAGWEAWRLLCHGMSLQALLCFTGVLLFPRFQILCHLLFKKMTRQRLDCVQEINISSCLSSGGRIFFLCQSWFNVWFVYVAQPVTLMEALWQNGLYCFMSSCLLSASCLLPFPSDMASEGRSKAFACFQLHQSFDKSKSWS